MAENEKIIRELTRLANRPEPLDQNKWDKLIKQREEILDEYMSYASIDQTR